MATATIAMTNPGVLIEPIDELILKLVGGSEEILDTVHNNLRRAESWGVRGERHYL